MPGRRSSMRCPAPTAIWGRLSAYNTATMQAAWTFQQKAPFLTGVLTTAGGVAYVGDFDRRFRAIDTKTGQTLWKTRLGTSVQGHVIPSRWTASSILPSKPALAAAARWARRPH